MQADGASSEVVEIIRRAIQKITSGYPIELLAKVTYSDGRVPPDLPPIGNSFI